MGRAVIYVDANVIIRFVEGDVVTRGPLQKRLDSRGSAERLLTSQFSRLECRTKPLRSGDLVVLDLYDRFFQSGDLQIIPVTLQVIEEATRIRAEYRLKSPDAIQLASAFVGGAVAFLTGDKQLKRFNEVPVELL